MSRETRHSAFFRVGLITWHPQDKWQEIDVQVRRECSVYADYDDKGKFVCVHADGDVYLEQPLPEWGLDIGDNLNKIPLFDKIAKEVDLTKEMI